MYTLRKVVDNVQSNQNLGIQYQVIEKETNKKEFKKAKEFFFGEEEENSCYAIIVCNGGSELIPLYKNQSNYIMTESGKTFSNLTFK